MDEAVSTIEYDQRAIVVIFGIQSQGASLGGQRDVGPSEMECRHCQCGS